MLEIYLEAIGDDGLKARKTRSFAVRCAMVSPLAKMQYACGLCAKCQMSADVVRAAHDLGGFGPDTIKLSN
jgi:hypothetical protein